MKATIIEDNRTVELEGTPQEIKEVLGYGFSVTEIHLNPPWKAPEVSPHFPYVPHIEPFPQPWFPLPDFTWTKPYWTCDGQAPVQNDTKTCTIVDNKL